MNFNQQTFSSPKLTTNSNFPDCTGTNSAPSTSSYLVIDRSSSCDPNPFKIARVDYGLGVSPTMMNIKLEDNDPSVETQHSFVQQFHAPETEEFGAYGSFIQKETVEVSFSSFFLFT